jgi:hypothetical protein
MSTNVEHPQLAVADALAWPVAVIVGLLALQRPAIVGPGLAGFAAVWAAMRLRRALGHGRQPYKLTTYRVLRWTIYFVLFAVVLSLAHRYGVAR